MEQVKTTAALWPSQARGHVNLGVNMNHNITGLIITVEILKEVKKIDRGVMLLRMNGRIVICPKMMRKNVSYAFFCEIFTIY